MKRIRYVAVTAVMLAFAAGLTAIAPRAMSHADAVPSASGITDYAAQSTPSPAADTVPGTSGITTSISNVSQNNNGNGGCWIEVDGQIGADSSTNPNVWSETNGALSDLKPVSAGANGITTIFMNELAGNPERDPPVTGFQASGEIDCSLITAADAYVKKRGYGNAAHFGQLVLDAGRHPAPAGSRLHAEQRAVLLAYAGSPVWVTRAVAAAAGVAAYFTLSALTAAAAAALGYSLAGPGIAVAAVNGLSGCLAGAVSTYVAAAINGTAGDKTTFSTAAVECLAWGVTSVITATQLGTWLGGALRARLPLPTKTVPVTAQQAEAIEAAVMGSAGTGAIASSRSAIPSDVATDMTRVLEWMEDAFGTPSGNL